MKQSFNDCLSAISTIRLATMTTSVEPSQAERLEAVADATIAGPGATDRTSATEQTQQNHGNAASSTSSANGVEQNGVEKPPQAPQAPERSKGKIALIMGSLMVCKRVSNEQLGFQANY